MSRNMSHKPTGYCHHSVVYLNFVLLVSLRQMSIIETQYDESLMP